jgi:high-affinity nickel-transport protein
MSLLDTIDGSFMNFAYGWAFSKPVRKIFYNITITALSVCVALVIGSIEIIGLLSEKAGFDGSLWAWFQAIDINTLGFIIVGMFVLTWAVALSVWHFGKIEERWTAPIKRANVD